MPDETEQFRRHQVAEINQEVEGDKDSERKRLEEKYGADQVWDTEELGKIFTVKGFMAPYCDVERKKDGARGSVAFQHSPRLYFNFES